MQIHDQTYADAVLWKRPKEKDRLIDEFQIEQVRALPHCNRGSLCQVTTLMRGRQ